MNLTEEHIGMLKSAGFKWYEISHFKAGRKNKVSKQKIREMRRLISPAKKQRKIFTVVRGKYQITNYSKKRIETDERKARETQQAG
ncbi:MAG: hypothetical protein KKB34_10355 [Bacteroidetes bacterium]|nr:hypothetical protein [Bacteroidota bacterium]